VLFNVIMILLVTGLITALLVAFQHARPIRDKAAR
jgi:hypothetical protein